MAPGISGDKQKATINQLQDNPTLAYQNNKSKVILHTEGISDLKNLSVIPCIFPFNPLGQLDKIDVCFEEYKVTQMVILIVLLFLIKPSCWSNLMWCILPSSHPIFGLIEKKKEKQFTFTQQGQQCTFIFQLSNLLTLTFCCNLAHKNFSYLAISQSIRLEHCMDMSSNRTWRVKKNRHPPCLGTTNTCQKE